MIKNTILSFLRWIGSILIRITEADCKDYLRPTTEPARTIYDAFVLESEKRRGKESEDWIRDERLAVYNAALNWCLKNDYECPEMKDLIDSENYAYGSADYGSKWAINFANKITKPENKLPESELK